MYFFLVVVVVVVVVVVENRYCGGAFSLSSQSVERAASQLSSARPLGGPPLFPGPRATSGTDPSVSVPRAPEPLNTNTQEVRGEATWRCSSLCTCTVVQIWSRPGPDLVQTRHSLRIVIVAGLVLASLTCRSNWNGGRASSREQWHGGGRWCRRGEQQLRRSRLVTTWLPPGYHGHRTAIVGSGCWTHLDTQELRYASIQPCAPLHHSAQGEK